MAPNRVSVFVCALLSCFLFQLLPAEVTGSTVPAFTISDSRSSGAGVIDYTSLTWDDLAVKLLGSGEESKIEARPSAIVAVLTNQDGKELQHVWEGSAPSLMLPHMLLDGTDGASASSLAASFEKAGQQGKVLAVGSCNLPEGTAEVVASSADLKVYLETRASTRSPGTTDLIFVCSTDDSLVSESVEAVKSIVPGHVLLYTQGESGVEGGVRSRMLVASSLQGKNDANVTSTCDGLCTTKVMILETIFVAVTLLIVLVSGLCCLAAIDTPTRFEVPRDT